METQLLAARDTIRLHALAAQSQKDALTPRELARNDALIDISDYSGVCHGLHPEYAEFGVLNRRH